MKIAFSLLLPILAAAGPLRPGSVNFEDAPMVSSIDAKTIPDNYIVVLKKHVKESKPHLSWLQSTHSQARLELRKRSTGPFEDFLGLKHTFSIGEVTGYSGHFDEDTIEKVRKHEDVSYY